MDFPKLNLPNIEFKTKLVDGNIQVFDIVRKKYFKLTAEEWVRQHFIHYLNLDRNYPLGLMGIEKVIKYNGLRTRADIVLYDNHGSAYMLVECKAPNINITKDTFDQVAKYNFNLKVKYLVVTNGLKHFCCEMNYIEKKISFLNQIPLF